MDVYPWVVIAHILAVILALGAHGVSAFAIFRVKAEPDRDKLKATLEMSSGSLTLAGWGLLVAVILGIVAAVMGGHFSRLWPWASIVVVVILFGVMTPMAANPMSKVREALGMALRGDKPGDPPREPASDEVLAAARARLRPELVAAIASIGIVLLVWMMETKPF